MKWTETIETKDRLECRLHDGDGTVYVSYMQALGSGDVELGVYDIPEYSLAVIVGNLSVACQ